MFTCINLLHSYFLLLELQSSVSKFSQQCDQHVQYKASLEEKMEALNSQFTCLQQSNNHLTEEVCTYVYAHNITFVCNEIFQPVYFSWKHVD